MKKVIFGTSALLLALVVGVLIVSQFRTKDATPNKNTNTSIKTKTAEFTYGDFIFDIPIDMTKSVGEGGTTWTFPSGVADGVSISFTQPADTAENLVTSQKASLTPPDTIIQENKVKVHGEEWRMLEVSTNIGVNMISWISEHQPTVEVQFPRARAELTTTLEHIVRSAHLKVK